MGYHLVMERAFDGLVELVRRLRRECPWDQSQTLESLKNCLIEEAHEVKEAVEAGDPSRLKDEFGDLLTLVLMNLEIASEEGLFDLEETASHACSKLEKRHPHVFGSKSLDTPQEVYSSWEVSKITDGGSILKSVPRSLPPLMLAHIVQKRAAGVGFDWEKVDDVFAKVEEELAELKSIDSDDSSARLEEFGDLLFSVINLARFLKVDPEQALRHTIEKFSRRFGEIEAEIVESGRRMDDVTLSEMDRLWEAAKKREKDV